MQQLLGWNMYLCVIVILAVTAIYTIAGTLEHSTRTGVRLIHDWLVKTNVCPALTQFAREPMVGETNVRIHKVSSDVLEMNVASNYFAFVVISE